MPVTVCTTCATAVAVLPAPSPNSHLASSGTIVMADCFCSALVSVGARCVFTAHGGVARERDSESYGSRDGEGDYKRNQQTPQVRPVATAPGPTPTRMPAEVGDNLEQQFDPFAGHVGRLKRKARHIAARPRQVIDKAAAQRIDGDRKDNRNRGRGLHGSQDRVASDNHNIHLVPNERVDIIAN